MTVVKKLAAALGSLAGLAVTANGYRPLSKRGYPSMYAFSFGVFASELPLQMIAAQFAALAAITRRLSPRLRRFSWLVSALSWVGLLGLNRLGHQANVPLTAALDAGLGTDRRTESADLWKRPAGAGTAKSPGVVRMLRIYRDYAHDTDISYGDYGSRNHLDIWRRPDLDRGGRAPVLLQVPGGAWMVGSKRQQAYPLMSHLAELGLGVRGDQLPAQSALHLARSHRRRQAGAGVDQGTHRRIRRRPRLGRDHRGFGRRAPVVVGRSHRERSSVSARLRGRRHQRARSGPVLRRLRLHPDRQCDPPADGADVGEVRVQTAAS